MSLLIGEWNLEDSVDFDKYMEVVGVDMATRLGAKLVKPTVTIAKNGDTWSIKSSSTFKNHEFTFTPGTEFELTTADGRHVKATLHFEGDNKLVQKESGKVDSTITREATADTLIATCEAPGVVSKRTYKRKA